MNSSINKLFYDDGSVLVIPWHCVLKSIKRR